MNNPKVKIIAIQNLSNWIKSILNTKQKTVTGNPKAGNPTTEAMAQQYYCTIQPKKQ